MKKKYFRLGCRRRSNDWTRPVAISCRPVRQTQINEPKIRRLKDGDFRSKEKVTNNLSLQYINRRKIKQVDVWFLRPRANCLVSRDWRAAVSSCPSYQSRPVESEKYRLLWGKRIETMAMVAAVRSLASRRFRWWKVCTRNWQGGWQTSHCWTDGRLSVRFADASRRLPFGFDHSFVFLSVVSSENCLNHSKAIDFFY